MKKLLSLLLAVTLLVTVCAGCGGNTANNSNASGNTSGNTSNSAADTTTTTPSEPSGSSSAAAGDTLLTTLTGIRPDEIIATVGDIEVPAEVYFYWLVYNCSSLEYQLMMYALYYDEYAHLMNDDGSIVWDGMLNSTQTVAQYAMEQTNSTVIFYAAIEDLAREHGITLSSDALAAVQADQDALREQLGGDDIYQAYLQISSLSEDTLTLIGTTSALYDALLESVMTEGSPLYLTPAGYDEMATYADHILLATIDLSTGAALSDDEIAAKRSTAEDLLAQLRASDDPVTLFGQLADEYSEDTGRATNPTGYIYTPGTMVTVFEDTASALEVGQISEIIESDYGYHILLRRDLQEGLAANEEQHKTLADTYLSTLLVERMQELSVTFSDVLNTVDVANYYVSSTTALESFQNQLQAGADGEHSADDGHDHSAG